MKVKLKAVIELTVDELCELARKCPELGLGCLAASDCEQAEQANDDDDETPAERE